VVVLEIDHVIPVCQGGTNDDENLIVACEDCNRGKGGKTIPQAAPTESDRLRIAQELREQVRAAEDAKVSAEARKSTRDTLMDYWCSQTERDSVDSQTLNVLLSYVDEHGFKTVLGWIDMAIENSVAIFHESAVRRWRSRHEISCISVVSGRLSCKPACATHDP